MTELMFMLDAVFVAGLAAWMIVAVADNWRHPALNEEAVAMVVRLDLMEAEFPEAFAQVAYRRITDPGRIRALFRLMRAAETVAAVALVVSTLLLLGAALHVVPAAVAQGAALLSVAWFSSIWAGFIIGGNYFCYWYAHQWAQMNHVSFLVWGMLVFLVLLN